MPIPIQRPQTLTLQSLRQACRTHPLITPLHFPLPLPYPLPKIPDPRISPIDKNPQDNLIAYSQTIHNNLLIHSVQFNKQHNIINTIIHKIR